MSTRLKRSRRLGATALGLALIASACGSSATEDASTSSNAEAAAGEAAAGAGLPALVGDTVSGGQLDTNDLAGQDVVVWFWAPW